MNATIDNEIMLSRNQFYQSPNCIDGSKRFTKFNELTLLTDEVIVEYMDLNQMELTFHKLLFVYLAAKWICKIVHLSVTYFAPMLTSENAMQYYMYSY